MVEENKVGDEEMQVVNAAPIAIADALRNFGAGRFHLLNAKDFVNKVINSPLSIKVENKIVINDAEVAAKNTLNVPIE